MLKGSQGVFCVPGTLNVSLLKVFVKKTLITQSEKKKLLRALASSTDIHFIHFAFLAC